MVIYRAAMTAKCESQYNLKCMFLNSGRKPNNLVVETALPLCNQNTSMQRFFTVTSGSLFYVLLLIWLFQFHKSKIKQVTCLWAVGFCVCVCVYIYIMYTKIMKLNKRQQDARGINHLKTFLQVVLFSLTELKHVVHRFIWYLVIKSSKVTAAQN